MISVGWTGAAILAGLVAGVAVFSVRRALPALFRLLADIRETRASASDAAANALVAYQASRGTFDLAPVHGAPADFPEGTWRRIGGNGVGWPADTFYKVRGLAELQGTLYAGLTGPRQDGSRGEVWAWNGESWSHVGGGPGSWPAEPAFVDHLIAFDGSLYAAVGAKIWRLSGGKWEVVATVSQTEGAGSYCFAEHQGRLLTGCWGRPAVLALDRAGNVEHLPYPYADGWEKGTRTIYCLASFGGHLYAGTGTGRLESGGSGVYRFDGQRWEKVGGNGIRGSWTETGIPFVLGMIVFKDRLVATLSRRPDAPAPSTSVWAFDGNEWRPVGVGQTPAGMANATILNDLTSFAGHLVVATGSGAGRDARLFALDKGGHWHDVSGDALRPAENGLEGGYWIYRLATSGDRLYAATAGHRGAASVFEYVAHG